jgi:L-rhamnose mutarotase
MERVGWVWRVRPGCAEEYARRHAEIWPEMARVLRAAGVRAFHIHRWGDVVFGHLDVEDYDRMVRLTARDPVAERWEVHMQDLIEYPNADPATGAPERLRHVWSLPDGAREEGG